MDDFYWRIAFEPPAENLTESHKILIIYSVRKDYKNMWFCITRQVVTCNGFP